MRMLQEPAKCATKLGSRIPHAALLHARRKLGCIFLDGLCPCGRVLVQDDVVPREVVEVVDAATCAHEEDLLLAQGAERLANFEMEVWVEAPVDGHDGHGRAGAGVWVHPSEGDHDVLVPDSLNGELNELFAA